MLGFDFDLTCDSMFPMKKLFLLALIFSGIIFALTDTDSDGVSDEVDICPRVYARSTTGCPTLSAATASTNTNNCLTSQLKLGKTIATVTPICDTKTKVCPKIANILGAQSCDPIFPVIFDATTGLVLVRGSVFIIDYTK